MDVHGGPSRRNDLAQPCVGLIRRFRIVTTVTILQQRRLQRRPAGALGSSSVKLSLLGGPNRNSWLWPAEELSKGWRFLTTYAEVQTSPVLRHLIHRTRDSECK